MDLMARSRLVRERGKNIGFALLGVLLRLLATVMYKAGEEVRLNASYH
jgi:hypothetical protein